MPDDATSDDIAAADHLDAHIQHLGVAVVVSPSAVIETSAARTLIARVHIAGGATVGTATRVSRTEPWATGYETAAGG